MFSQTTLLYSVPDRQWDGDDEEADKRSDGICLASCNQGIKGIMALLFVVGSTSQTFRSRVEYSLTAFSIFVAQQHKHALSTCLQHGFETSDDVVQYLYGLLTRTTIDNRSLIYN